MKVRFHWKPEIGGLNPECLAHSSHFRRHPTLILEGEQVLDHRVAECDVETGVAELREVGCVTRERLYIVMSLLFRFKVQAEDPNTGASRPPAVFPESSFPAHIEDSQRSRQPLCQRLKELESLGAELVGKRIGVLAAREAA